MLAYIILLVINDSSIDITMLKGQQNSNIVFHSVKVMASSWEDYPEATNVIYDSDRIIQRAVDTFYSLKHGCDVCVDAEGPSMFVIPGHPVTNK